MTFAINGYMAKSPTANEEGGAEKVWEESLYHKPKLGLKTEREVEGRIFQKEEQYV